MNEYESESSAPKREMVKELSKPQRRALGVLIEKGFTTPDGYPLTLKALTTGCNQKSNRAPVTNYSEDAIYDTMEELREMGLAAVVHMESGRTERYRHYMRKNFSFTEAQIAILAELWLRGRQSMGELRGRASRMHAIDTLDALRDELGSLMDSGFVQASGDLKRRGIEVDHNFYPASEGQTIASTSAPINPPSQSQAEPRRRPEQSQPEQTSAVVASAPVASVVSDEVQNTMLLNQAALQSEVQELRSAVSELRDELEELKSQLGV